MPFPVTYLIDHLAPSETFVRREIEQLGQRGWPIFVRVLKGGEGALEHAALSCPEGARRRFFKAVSARLADELVRSPVTALRILKRLPQAASLARAARETDCKLIHAHFAGITADLASLAARALDIPWTCSVHAHDVFATNPNLLRRRLRTANAIIACSQAAARAVIAAGIEEEKVKVIHHGLPLYSYPFDPARSGGKIFAACRLEPKKGMDTLLLACSLLRKRNVRFNCVIAGAGPQLNALNELTVRIGLSDRVEFVGWLPQGETHSHVISASALVLPSRRTADGDRDGIANILVEGLALGTPVVTTTAGAAPEVITDNLNGLLVPPDDPERLADALARLLASPETRLRLAEAGRHTAVTQFDGGACIRQLETVFTQAASPAQ